MDERWLRIDVLMMTHDPWFISLGLWLKKTDYEWMLTNTDNEILKSMDWWLMTDMTDDW